MFQLQCGESCNGVIDSWKLPCTPSVKQDMHEITRPLADCQASYEPYLQTVAYCLKSRCFAEPWHKVEHYWSWLQGDRNSKWPSLMDAMPQTVPPLAPVGMKTLNYTVQVRDEPYDFDYQTAQSFAWNERWHERMSYILVFVFLGALMVGAVHKLVQSNLHRPYHPSSIRSSRFVTSIQKHLVMPALFNGAHQTPVLHGLGYLPSRLMTVFLILMVGVTAIANSVPYKSVQPNEWATNRRQEMMGFVSNRAGLISFALIPVTILLSARNNPLLWMTGWSMSTMITLHRWVARMCAFQAVIHSVGWTVQWYWDEGNWSEFRSEGAMLYMQWGFMATVVICIMLVFASLPFRKWSYEIFLVLHVLFAIFLILGCYYHMVFRFKWRYGYLNWIYVAIGIWVADRSIRLITVWKNGLQGSIGKTSSLATAQLIADSNQQIIKLTVYPRLERGSVTPGTHYFVYFPSLSKPWENHPFSVAAWNLGETSVDTTHSDTSSHHKGKKSGLSSPETESAPEHHSDRPGITIFIKPHSGATQALTQSLVSAGPSPMPTNIPVLLEGPYGSAHPLHLYETVVLIAGGVGVTPALAYAQDLVARHGHGAQIVLVWAARDPGLIRAVRSMIPSQVDARIFCTAAKNVDHHDAAELRPDVSKLVRDEIALERPGRIAFFVCGPPTMVDEVRTACVACIGEDVPADRVGFYEESFSW